MDPRQRRTRSKLREAVFALAATQSVESITMADIARASGVTRDTVYRHGPDPARLLGDFLADDLASYLAAPAENGSVRQTFDVTERKLLGHVVARADIYRNAMAPKLLAPIRDALVSSISERLEKFLRDHPSIVPTVQKDLALPLQQRIWVAYGAGGTVAAIEEWLEAAPVLDPDKAARVIIAAAPQWWMRSEDGAGL